MKDYVKKYGIKLLALVIVVALVAGIAAAIAAITASVLGLDLTVCQRVGIFGLPCVLLQQIGNVTIFHGIISFLSIVG